MVSVKVTLLTLTTTALLCTGILVFDQRWVSEAPNLEQLETANSQKSLVVFAYKHSATSEENLHFFLRHGVLQLPEKLVDVVVWFNTQAEGDYDRTRVLVRGRNNIHVLPLQARDIRNECFDTGMWYQSIQYLAPELLNASSLPQAYRRLVFINAGVRGPFLSVAMRQLMQHSAETWLDLLDVGTDTHQSMFGMSINCFWEPHVQTMFWAVSPALFVQAVLPLWESYDYCPTTQTQAIDVGLNLSKSVHAAGGVLKVFASCYRRLELAKARLSFLAKRPLAKPLGVKP